jgi:hypothetical protein
MNWIPKSGRSISVNLHIKCKEIHIFLLSSTDVSSEELIETVYGLNHRLEGVNMQQREMEVRRMITKMRHIYSTSKDFFEECDEHGKFASDTGSDDEKYSSLPEGFRTKPSKTGKSAGARRLPQKSSKNISDARTDTDGQSEFVPDDDDSSTSSDDFSPGAHDLVVNDPVNVPNPSTSRAGTEMLPHSAVSGTSRGSIDVRLLEQSINEQKESIDRLVTEVANVSVKLGEVKSDLSTTTQQFITKEVSVLWP